MTIKIVNVKLKTEYSWQDMSEMSNWRAVKITNSSWRQPLQTALVCEQVTIEVEVMENNWAAVKESFSSWDEIRGQFENWLALKYW